MSDFALNCGDPQNIKASFISIVNILQNNVNIAISLHYS
jgi:hypothetical protein